MKHIHYILRRDISFDGTPTEIQVEVDKEDIEKRITIRKTYTDSEGNIWEICEEKEIENSISRDPFG